MAVAKKQGKEEPAKIGQRKVTGGSEDLSEDLRRNKQHSWPSPIYIGQAQGGGKKHTKRGAKGLRHSLFSLCLWVGMPSYLKAVFPDIL